MALVFLALGSLVLACICARQLNRFTREVTLAKQRLEVGDTVETSLLPRSPELRSLVTAMNEMAEQLEERIAMITRQRNEHHAVLASMVEGVIAVDNSERVLSINPAASRLLGLDANWVSGRTVPEVIRNFSLQTLVLKALSTDDLVEEDMVLPAPEKVTLQVRGTALRDDEGKRIGALIVINDVTNVRRLEQMRQDFVANVSHELRTPLTSVKGFVETLLDGALSDSEASGRFLGIVSKHVDRLISIVESLLELTRLEAATGGHGIGLRQENVVSIVRNAIQACQPKADLREVRLLFEPNGELVRAVNPDLLEQAIVNLIENAIKFSPPGKSVSVSLADRGAEIEITVRDEGCGIPNEHLSRIFERFYRVDKGRSRRDGGVGLGLAITKHIVMAHEGRVAVASTVGKGSAFSIFLSPEVEQTGMTS